MAADTDPSQDSLEAYRRRGREWQVVRITANLAAPTVRELGTPAQRDRFVRPVLCCEELVCQLFSEPGAGSDLAGISTRPVQDRDGWTIDGAKVWTSGGGRARTSETRGPADFAWNQHVLGAPGFRIAGGSDEIQRTIIAERVLGLPPEPRTPA